MPAEPGYHDALRRITEETGTYLIIDETHTMACGPGGYTRVYGLRPDMLTVGKSLAGGIPIAAYGMRRELADRLVASTSDEALGDNGSIGSTLGGNALAMAAARATLEHVLTEEAFARTIPLAERYAANVRETIATRRLPWHIVQLGARAEYRFGAVPPRNGGESAALDDPDLNTYMRCYLMNRGVLVTPFQNMVLIAPTTTTEDVDRLSQVFADAADELLASD